MRRFRLENTAEGCLDLFQAHPRGAAITTTFDMATHGFAICFFQFTVQPSAD
jgi:hypothetical protein